MAIDKQARGMLANALSGFMQGTIRSDDFDNTVSGYGWAKRTTDQSLVSISKVLYLLYGEDRNEKINVPEETWQALGRVLAFLQTDLDYVHGAEFRWDAVQAHWPFASAIEWEAHRHLQPAAILESDHSYVPQTDKSTLRAAMEVFGMVIGCLAVAAALLLLWANWHR